MSIKKIASTTFFCTFLFLFVYSIPIHSSNIDDIIEQHRLAEEVAGFGHWTFNLNTGTMTASKGAHRIYGLLDEEMTIEDAQKYPLPKYREMLDNALNDLVEKGTAYNMEFRIKRPLDNQILWIHSVASYNKETNSVFGIIRDITKEKDSKYLLESILTTAPAGIGMVINRKIHQANNYIFDLTGYSENEIIDKSTRFLYPTREESEYVGTEKYRQISQKGTGTVETRWITKNGEIKNVIISSTPLDTSNLELGVTFTVLDITTRKNMEKAIAERTKWAFIGISIFVTVLLLLILSLYKKTNTLKMRSNELQISEKKYRRLAENTPAVVYQYKMSPKGKLSFPYISESIFTFTGIKAQDVMTNPKLLLDMIHPDDRQKYYTEGIESAKTMQSYHGVFRVVSTNQTMWVEARSTPENLIDGSVTWDGFMVDVTARKDAEQELLRKTEELENYFTSALDLLCIADINGNFIRVNKEWETVLGYSIQELENKQFLDFVHPDDIESTLEVVKNLDSQKNIINFTNRYKTKTGQYRFIEWRSTPKGELIYAAARDITERIEAEKSIKAWQQMMEYIVKYDPSAIAILDKDLNFKFVSDRFMKDYGVEDTAIIGKYHYDVFPDLPEKWKEVHKKALAGEVLREDESRYDREDGSTDWTKWECRPWYQFDGEVGGIVVYTEVITERKQAQIKTETAEKLFRTLFSDSPASILIFNNETFDIYDANYAACKVYGLETIEQLRGNSLFLDSPYSKKEAVEFFEKTVEEGPQYFLWKSKKITGETVWEDVRTVAIEIEGTKKILAVGIDITDKTNAEEQLKNSEQKYRLLFENMIAGFALHEMVYDENGNGIDYKFLEINSAFEQMTGASSKAIIGKTVKEVMPETEDYWIKTYEDVSKTGKPIAYQNYSSQVDRHFDVWAFSPGIDKFATVFVDITDRKIAEELLEAKNKELEQIIYVASHDLRSPLVNVDGYTREVGYCLDDLQTLLLKDNIDEAKLKEINNIFSEITEDISRVRNSSKQMDSLLNGLLKLSRSGRAALEIGEIFMNDLMEKVLSSFSYQIEESDIDLTVENLPNCMADEVQITQVFTNLISNAIKYLNPDKKGVIIISGKTIKTKCLYCVHDNGIGIDKHHQKQIFELFHRLNPSKNEGEGLGLSIVRQALMRLKGNIRVESEAGKGSKFFVSLPAVKQ